MRSPLGRRPSRIAVMICSSVQPPIPVALSGVMFVAYTVPKGPSNFLPPALGWPLGSVWQPQPPAAPKMYLPRVTSAGSAATAAPAHQVTRQVARRSRRTAVILTQSGRHRFPLPSRLSRRLAAVGGVVLLLVPEHPGCLHGLARELAHIGRRSRGTHEQLLVVTEDTLPDRRSTRSRDGHEPVVHAHEHGAVATEPQPHPAIAEGDARRSYAHLDGGARVGALRHGSPDPAAIHPDPHGLVLAASFGGQEEDLGERGHADGVATSCPERGTDARGGANAVALVELGAKVGRLPRRIALLVRLGLARERHHRRGQLPRLGHRRKETQAEHHPEDKPGQSTRAQCHGILHLLSSRPAGWPLLAHEQGLARHDSSSRPSTMSRNCLRMRAVAPQMTSSTVTVKKWTGCGVPSRSQSSVRKMFGSRSVSRGTSSTRSISRPSAWNFTSRVTIPTTGVMMNGVARVAVSSRSPSTSTASGGSLISSHASRKAVSTREPSRSSTMPPGNENCPLWCGTSADFLVKSM